MSDTILCPVCETENAPTATHCEVCGERLTPPGPGEEVSPEENVSAMMQAEAEHEMAMPELPSSDADDAVPALRPSFTPASDEDDAQDEDGEPSIAESPAFLYSSLDGTAFPAGSPEYEDGFGPNGEELVSEPPMEVAVEPADPYAEGEDHGAHEDAYGDDDRDADGTAASEGYGESEVDEAPAAAAATGPSAAFSAAFPVRTKVRPETAPLPTPGVHAAPATLTLYVNRQPVHSHAIDTDETLIGRRDPVADAYPEVDLTSWDSTSAVSRKHAYVYRQNRNYQLYVVSNAGTQLNAELLSLGDRRPLKSGDVVVLAGKFAMKFEVPAE